MNRACSWRDGGPSGARVQSFPHNWGEIVMKISILGGGGFLGRKIAAQLARDGTLGGEPITGLTLFDVAAPAALQAPFPVRLVGGDVIALPDDAIPAGTDVIFHL